MRPRAGAAVVIAAVAIGAVGIAWLQDVPDITAEDAVTAAEGALEEAGLEAEVEQEAQRSVYTTRARDPIDVWAVHATVRTVPIELRLAMAGAHPVSIDDRTPDGSAYVLSELEYEAVASSIDDPARDRRVERNISLTLAAALVVSLAVAHAAVAARSKEGTG
jgi:hypothetical protein